MFGYGSLIWRPGFEYVDSQLATVDGYVRNFCQASHDHRGTPDAPGRVVTITPDVSAQCTGMAYRLGVNANTVLRNLDIREQDGYERVSVPITLDDGKQSVGVTWIASAGNPSWRANESLHEIATLIASREGPSGTNREYLFELESALAAREIKDAYVPRLSRAVRALL